MAKTPSFPLVLAERDRSHGRAAVRKDAGDDPDVTHGALVESWVRPAPPGAGIVFRAGEGVGIVTRPGLSLAVGEPAINPAPRKMIAAMLNELAPALGGPADVCVTIGIPDGRRLAQRTMNGRLGIVGGLSVLGTSGIVKPYSCAAWIASIRQGIDVAAATGATHLAAATGRVSEEAARALYGLDESALIDMGDFAGATLKLIRRKPVPRLTIAGGFGKISKLADGHMDLHSARSSVDRTGLIRRLAALGASGRDAGRGTGRRIGGRDPRDCDRGRTSTRRRGRRGGSCCGRGRARRQHGFSPKWTCSSSTAQAASLAAPAPEQPLRLLILGGTAEGRALAGAAEGRFGPSLTVISALAGPYSRAAPARRHCPHRRLRRDGGSRVLSQGRADRPPDRCHPSVCHADLGPGARGGGAR